MFIITSSTGIFKSFAFNSLVKSKADIFSIYIQEPKNQISASIAKQIALSRALNIRNMLRKKGVNDSKVAIKLKEKNSIEQTIEHSPGYAMIVVNTQK